MQQTHFILQHMESILFVPCRMSEISISRHGRLFFTRVWPFFFSHSQFVYYFIFFCFCDCLSDCGTQFFLYLQLPNVCVRYKNNNNESYDIWIILLKNDNNDNNFDRFNNIYIIWMKRDNISYGAHSFEIRIY